MTRKSKKQRLEIIHPRCAGIDIGSREHWVAVDPGQDDEPVRCFSAFSDDLYALADWLESMNVEVVAMETTGVYWIPCMKSLMHAVCRYLSSTRGQHGKSRAANPMYSTANGSGS